MECFISDELLRRDEPTSCFFYDDNEEPLLALIDKNKGEILQIDGNHNRIVFLLKGKISFLEGFTCRTFEADNFILLPRGCKYTLNMEENASLVIVHVRNRINFCEHFSFVTLHQLNKSLKNYHPTVHSLKTNTIIYSYLNNIIMMLSEGLKCRYFHDIKQEELLHYLRAYYTENDLVAFFAPMLNDDTDFVELIYQNLESAKTIADLANITNYSLSGFKKHFSKIFGMNPYNWMEKEKAKKIHYEINCTQKSFKEISVQYNFYSSSHFTRFCNKMYGMSPTMLREKNRGKITLAPIMVK